MKTSRARTATRRILWSLGRWCALVCCASFGWTEAADFEVEVSLRIEGNGKPYTAGIVVPAPWPEQSVERIEEKIRNGKARVDKVGSGCAMLVLQGEATSPGDYSEVIQRYRVHVSPIPLTLSREDFDAEQKEVPKSSGRLLAEFLKSSPGIDVKDAGIRELSTTLAKDSPHPWDYAHSAFHWVHREIRYKEGEFTSAADAVRDLVGDCEEKSSVFIALCRARKIPARTVWAPGHCWAEFHLTDRDGHSHWIPAHTSGTPWFAEMKSPQVILQKGDNFRPPQKKSGATRLLGPWIRGALPQPKWEHKLEVREMSPSTGPEATHESPNRD